MARPLVQQPFYRYPICHFSTKPTLVLQSINKTGSHQPYAPTWRKLMLPNIRHIIFVINVL